MTYHFLRYIFKPTHGYILVRQKRLIEKRVCSRNILREILIESAYIELLT